MAGFVMIGVVMIGVLIAGLVITGVVMGGFVMIGVIKGGVRIIGLVITGVLMIRAGLTVDKSPAILFRHTRNIMVRMVTVPYLSPTEQRVLFILSSFVFMA